MANGRTGRVVIDFARRVDGHCVLAVHDDGDGFDPASPECRERFGLWLARSLAAQVRGAFSVTPKPGVTAQLVFPLEA